ncbi:MAG: asparagine synthase (glutamine-hydrolyzing) [bacterium]|nr:asparagine synthase (glutamine-hydrolyzing) [bacterium]
MCGIVGILDLRGGRPAVDRVGEMLREIRHRGPDADGVWAEGPVALGHVRLSIIDLAGGAQPMSNPAGNLHITFNGEIFNFPELRQGLVERGYAFRTRSDTEVILALYEEQGSACVEQLNGQFAFAIWDDQDQSLFLSRDRLGIRPLYYADPASHDPTQFVFASEIKALFAHPCVAREFDLRGIDEVLTYWTAQAPRTAFKGIRALPPGHSMRIKQGTIELWTYWSLRFGERAYDLSDDEAAEQLREHLIRSTKLRLRSDVPVGSYLSGGLDSSLIVAMITGESDAALETFSVAFESDEFDESSFQREVSRHLGTSHSEILCTPFQIGEVFPEVIRHAESPILRTAPAPLYRLSRLVRESGYKVVLTGEGADEILGGYDLFKEAKIRRFWSRFPESNLRPLLLRRLYPYLKNLQAQPEAYRRAFFHVKATDLDNPFFSHLPRWDMTVGIKRFYSRETKERLKGFDPREDLEQTLPTGFAKWHQFEQAQYLEATILMPGYILASQGDRMLMGNSVEGRFPFLDHHLVEFAARLHPRQKMKALNEKFILKRALGHLLPASVCQRKKQPYRAPDAVSLLGDGERIPRPEYCRDLLSPARLDQYGIFSSTAVEKLLRKWRMGRSIGVRDNMALVGVLSTQLLARQFLDSD